VLVREDEDGALAIGQLSHAWLAGQLARAWGNELFPPADPHEEIVLGAEQHDIGWALFDRRPTFNPQTGLPLPFLGLTVEQHLSIWRGAPDRLISQSLYAALVTSLHGASISELRANVAPDDASALQSHIEEERARQAELSTLLGLSADRVASIRRQMWTWDSISLALCHGWRPFTAKDVPARDGLRDVELREGRDGTTSLDPWPFATRRVEVRCEARRLAASYPDEAALRSAFEKAPLVTLKFELAAA
jgi:hypothetical protein